MLITIERYLTGEQKKGCLKYYLFYLIELGGISYGKIKNKYITEQKGFELINQINQECIGKSKKQSITLDTYNFHSINNFWFCNTNIKKEKVYRMLLVPTMDIVFVLSGT